MTTAEQMAELIRNGYGIGWLAKHKMYWAFKFDETDDRRIGWLGTGDGKEWKLPSEICADETFDGAVSRTHQNLIERNRTGRFVGDVN